MSPSKLVFIGAKKAFEKLRIDCKKGVAPVVGKEVECTPDYKAKILLVKLSCTKKLDLENKPVSIFSCPTKKVK